VDRSDAYGQPQQGQYPHQGQFPPQQQFPPDDPQAVQPPQPGQPGMQSQSRPSRPPYGLPAQVTLNPGTFVTMRINQGLSSDHNQPGDTFSGTLIQPVVADGIVVAQRGQQVYGRVSEAVKAKTGSSSRLGVELTSLTLADGTQVPIRTQLVARQGGSTPPGVQAGTVVGTTALGAAIGGAVDWGRGAAIGAGAGAAAGIIGVLLTRNHPTFVYPETALTFRVESPVTVDTSRAPQAYRYVGPEEYQRGPDTAMRPRPVGPAPGYYYGPGPGPAYPYPYYYPYYYGPSVVVGWGPGYFYGYGRGFRRW
jgi:hypothetical protein